jgi:hypothetical protein
MLGVIRAVAVLGCLYAVVPPVDGQPRVDARNSYERVLAVVPPIGSGTHDDPIRPKFAPARNAIDTVGRTGIFAYTYVLSDDGKFALAEYFLQLDQQWNQQRLHEHGHVERDEWRIADLQARTSRAREQLRSALHLSPECTRRKLHNLLTGDLERAAGQHQHRPVDSA